MTIQKIFIIVIIVIFGVGGILGSYFLYSSGVMGEIIEKSAQRWYDMKKDTENKKASHNFEASCKNTGGSFERGVDPGHNLPEYLPKTKYGRLQKESSPSSYYSFCHANKGACTRDLGCFCAGWKYFGSVEEGCINPPEKKKH